ATTNAGVAVTIAVLANDSDPNGDALTVTGVTAAVGGSAAGNANNNVTFSPAAGFTGAGSFIYSISDGKGATASAGVSVTVSAVPTVVKNVSVGGTCVWKEA